MLAEILVALVIIGLSVGLLFQVISQGLERMRGGQAQADAATLAQSLLARVGTQIPLRSGEVVAGEEANFTWHLRLTRFGDSADQEAWPVSAFRVVAEVSWREQARPRMFVLETVRVGPREGMK